MKIGEICGAGFQPASKDADKMSSSKNAGKMPAPQGGREVEKKRDLDRRFVRGENSSLNREENSDGGREVGRG